jgi:DNA primase
LLRHEARLKADIRVTTLPEGMDPDDVVNRDPDNWKVILDNAKPIVVHVMETLAADYDLDDPKVKTEIASQIMPLIEDLPNSIERDTYRQRLARMLRVDERALIRSVRPRAYRGRRPTISSPPLEAEGEKKSMQAEISATYTREAHCLGILIRRPELTYLADRELQQDGLERISIQDFQNTDHQIILRLVKKSLEQDEDEPLNYVLNNLSISLMGLVDDILSRTQEIDPHSPAVLEDLLRAFLNLRRSNLRQNNDYMRYLLEEAEQNEDPRANEYQETVIKNAAMLHRLDKAENRYKNRSFIPGAG